MVLTTGGAHVNLFVNLSTSVLEVAVSLGGDPEYNGHNYT